MIHNRFLAAAALAVLAPAGAAVAQTTIVNKAVTETEVAGRPARLVRRARQHQPHG